VTIGLVENEIREAFADITFEIPTSRIVARAKRRRQRRRILAATLPVVVLLAGGGAAVLTAPELVPTNVICFDKADLQGGQITPANDGRSPQALCTESWRREHPSANRNDVPPFTVCALDNGPVGVFPTDDEKFCSSPGLQPMPQGYMDHVKQFAEMNKAMAWAIRDAAVKQGGSENHACLDSSTAVRVASQVMQQQGYGDWTVQTGTDQVGPCRMDVDFSPNDKIVTIYSTDPGTDSIMINTARARRFW
jgi:hypothetical protein